MQIQVLSKHFPLLLQLLGHILLLQSKPVNPALHEQNPAGKHIPLNEQLLGHVLISHFSPMNPSEQKHFPFMQTPTELQKSGHNFCSQEIPCQPELQITNPSRETTPLITLRIEQSGPNI